MIIVTNRGLVLATLALKNHINTLTEFLDVFMLEIVQMGWMREHVSVQAPPQVLLKKMHITCRRIAPPAILKPASLF